MLDALQTINKEIKERTDAMDTLSVSVPTSMLEDLSKLEWLPFVEGRNVSINKDKLILDWFTMPEDRTGFGIVASEFIEKLIGALDKIDEPHHFNEETIAAMEEARSGVGLSEAYDNVDDFMAALEE